MVPAVEAWQINPGQKVTTYAELNNDREDDGYGSPTIPGTKGTMAVTGSAGSTRVSRSRLVHGDERGSDLDPARHEHCPHAHRGHGRDPPQPDRDVDCCRKKGTRKKTKVTTT